MAESQKLDPQRIKGQSAGQQGGTRNAARAMPTHASMGDEERYALALESINHGVYDWDIVNNTVYYSPLLRAIFGMADDQTLTPEESGGRIHPDDIPQYRKAIIDHLKGATPHLLVEYRYLGNDESTWRWARQSGIAQRGPDGHAFRVTGATAD